jgi:2-polyprenyl-3-methyl-5-hydroxy-6-metoxy-1,4-benzoquinol methylase
MAALCEACFEVIRVAMGLVEQFGAIDIYLFDQLLRGNISAGMRVVDAGCGGGRNLVYLLREGYECFGVDQSAEAVAYVRAMAARLAPGLPSGNFRVEAVEAMSFADGFADVVVCNSVLHFAKVDAQFNGMVREVWRVLRPGGLMFCRLASTIGKEFERVVGRRFLMPDGQEWFLVDEALLMGLTAGLGGRLVDPLKTTVVQGSRCMTTWVVRKGQE